MDPFEFLNSINWDFESYPQLNDFIFIPFFALFFLPLRLFLDSFIFENLGRRLVLGKGHTLQDVKKHDTKKKLIKFKESAWKCIYYFSSEVLSIYVAYDGPWFTNSKYFWEGPGEQVWPDQKIKLKLKGESEVQSLLQSYSHILKNEKLYPEQEYKVTPKKKL